ncbi:MAG: hypothetical protein LBE48_04195, partial [Methanomassiliicoccaceae archaeon]|nr:hypothetical protein [Methanomassiliicoccaceae archaeon]
MITEFEQIRSLFVEISESIKENVNIYLIGGGALMYHESKRLTKDIDIVVNSREEFDSVIRSLEKARFRSMQPLDDAYLRLALFHVFMR